MSALSAAYFDLDGTLLGRGASLFHDGEGRISLLGARAIEACLRAEVEVVLMSGRRGSQVAEDARLIGQSSYIYECGSVLVLDGEEQWLTGKLQPGARSVFEQIADSGAPALLLEAFPGRLEYHAPFHADREVSHLFRGLVDAGAVDELLREHGHSDLRLVDNGVISRRSEALADLPSVHAYHLIPARASKAAAVALHMSIRGLSRQDTLAAGDSREDLGVAACVGTFWLLANALERDPSLRSELGRIPNVRVAEAGHGGGVYEAVITTLAESR
jgi:hydroxymethylpyrimidine pyrophosphatase-like HAD family hydrolase